MPARGKKKQKEEKTEEKEQYRTVVTLTCLEEAMSQLRLFQTENHRCAELTPRGCLQLK